MDTDDEADELDTVGGNNLPKLDDDAGLTCAGRGGGGMLKICANEGDWGVGVVLVCCVWLALASS